MSTNGVTGASYTSSTTPVSDTEASTGASGSSSSTSSSGTGSFGSMQALKENEPELYDAMVNSLVQQINTQSQDSEKRRKELAKEYQ